MQAPGGRLLLIRVRGCSIFDGHGIRSLLQEIDESLGDYIDPVLVENQYVVTKKMSKAMTMAWF